MQTDPNFPRARLCDDIGVKGAFGFPVKIKGQLIAVLEFFADQEMEPDENLLMMVRAVGEQVVARIERALGRGGARLLPVGRGGHQEPHERLDVPVDADGLAACAGGPMMQVDHVYHENLTPEKVDEILDALE